MLVCQMPNHNFSVALIPVCEVQFVCFSCGKQSEHILHLATRMTNSDRESLSYLAKSSLFLVSGEFTVTG